MIENKLDKAARKGIIVLLRLYQLTFSWFFGPCCRFRPSCSSYAIQAVLELGVLKGAWHSLRRILRCHPFDPGGYDPVPEMPTSFSRLNHNR